MNEMRYKGYVGSVEYTLEDGVLFGKIQGITPNYSYEAEDVKGLDREFRTAVDDYLEFCKLKGRKPEKPVEQPINYKPDPSHYQRAVDYAKKHDLSIEAVLDRALEAFLKQVA